MLRKLTLEFMMYIICQFITEFERSHYGIVEDIVYCCFLLAIILWKIVNI